MTSPDANPTSPTVVAAVPASPPDDVSKNRGITVLSYVGPLVMVPFLTSRKSPFARHHINQGVLLFLLELACCLGLLMGFILLRLAPHFVPERIYGLVSFSEFAVRAAALAAQLVFVILMLRGVAGVANGALSKLPVVGGLHILKPLKVAL